MSGVNIETLYGREEETTSQSLPPVHVSPDSSRHVLDQMMEEVDHSGGESRNALVSIPNITTATTTTNIITTPTFTISNPSGESPSRLPVPFPLNLRVPRDPSFNRPQTRRSRSIDFGPSLAMRMTRSERRSKELRDRTNILRTKVKNQNSLIVGLESEVEEAIFRINGLENTVLELQGRIEQFEAMFQAISKASTITSSSPT